MDVAHHPAGVTYEATADPESDPALVFVASRLPLDGEDVQRDLAFALRVLNFDDALLSQALEAIESQRLSIYDDGERRVIQKSRGQHIADAIGCRKPTSDLLPVINQEGQPVGILSLSDLTRAALEAPQDSPAGAAEPQLTAAARTFAAVCAQRRPGPNTPVA